MRIWDLQLLLAEKAMAPHSSTLAWKIPWTEEPGRLQSMGTLGVGHNWTTSLSLFTFIHWRRKRQPTPVFLPGESQGWGSLVGCHLWGSTESDTTEATYQQQQQQQQLLPELTPSALSLKKNLSSIPQFSSVQFSSSVVSNSLRPHESQHARPPYHQLPEFTQTHVRRVGDAIQPSHPLSSPFPPAPNPSQHQSLFQWVNSSHQVAKVLEFQL